MGPDGVENALGEPAAYRVAIALVAVAIALAGCRSREDSEPPVPDPRPNILIFLVDDLGWNDVGYHGSEIRTPRIDRLAREGVRLGRFYVTPICTSTRAGFLTGRSPMRYGLIYSVIQLWTNFGLPLDEHILPESFQAAGYATAMVGKWQLGHDHVRQLPFNRGFDHFYGLVHGPIDYFTHVVGFGPTVTGALDWQRNGRTVYEDGYATDLLAGEAIRLIETRDRGRPLLLYLAFNAAHSPLQAPQDLIDSYGEIDDPQRRIFAAMVESTDANIGSVLDALEREGIDDNTLVLFFSDNGSHQTWGRTGPLRGGKGSVFEGGIRVPAIVRWPAGLEGGREVSHVTSTLDVFPTLAAIAGVPARNEKPFDGRNVWPQIEGGEALPTNDLFFAVEQSEDFWFAVVHGEWKLVRVESKRNLDAKNYLFQIEDDESEANDVSAEHPAIVNGLMHRLITWRKLHPSTGIRRNINTPTLPVPASTNRSVEIG